MILKTEYDHNTCEKKVNFTFFYNGDLEHKLNVFKQIVKVMFEEDESDHICEYLNEYKPLTHTQLKNRKIFKAIQDDDISTLNEIFKSSELTSIEKYINDEIIKLNFDTLEIPDIPILFQFKEDYNVKIEIVVSQNRNDVWIIELK